MMRVLVAGATGYIGRYVAREFKERGDWVRVLARNPDALWSTGPALEPAIGRLVDDAFTGEATRPETLTRLCDGVDVVFSSLGVTRQTGPAGCMEVDYRANKNLLALAARAGVRKFVYVHVFNGHALRRLRSVRAKQKFVAELSRSNAPYAVVCPTGCFNDMAEVLRMAERGATFVVGDGAALINPIHGADLARVCADAVADDRVEVPVGGPELFTHRGIAELAFDVLGTPARVRRAPAWLLRAAVPLLRVVGGRLADLADGLATLAGTDCVAPRKGTHSLRAFFEELRRRPARRVFA